MIWRVSKPAKGWALAWALMRGCTVEAFWVAVYWRSVAAECCGSSTNQSQAQRLLPRQCQKFESACFPCGGDLRPTDLLISVAQKSELPQQLSLRLPLLESYPLFSPKFRCIAGDNEDKTEALVELREAYLLLRAKSQDSIRDSVAILQHHRNQSQFVPLLRESQVTEPSERALELPYRSWPNTSRLVLGGLSVWFLDDNGLRRRHLTIGQ